MVKQISIFLENKSGRLAKVTRVLGEQEVNIRALSIADTTDFGILRLIVDNPEKALEVLKEAGFAVSEAEVIAVEIPDSPGGLAGVMDVLEEAGVNIEYLYAFLKNSAQNAVVLFRVEAVDKAKEVLAARNINVLDGKTLYSL
ncbi:hypothetical protein GGQ84_001548 [Desulfitispora alkaliphila]|uniref:ACT domain-containing protein n=1 Tax=Desulfitispora alkaliphila TaxID=622674 RepID=UPI003D20F845